MSADADGYELAAQPPRPSDTVVIHGDQPKVVSLLDLAYLDVEEGTPVLDAAGELVGLCTGSYDGTTLMTVDTMPGDDATADPGRHDRGRDDRTADDDRRRDHRRVHELPSPAVPIRAWRSRPPSTSTTPDTEAVHGP